MPNAKKAQQLPDFKNESHEDAVAGFKALTKADMITGFKGVHIACTRAMSALAITDQTNRALNDQVETLKRALEEKDAEHQIALKTALEAKVSEHKTSIEEKDAQHQIALQAKDEAYKAKDEEHTAALEKIRGLEPYKRSLEAFKTTLGSKIDDQERKIATLEKDKAALEAKVSEHNTSIEEKDAAIKTALEKIQDLEPYKHALEQHKETMGSRIHSQQKTIDGLNNRIATLEAELEAKGASACDAADAAQQENLRAVVEVNPDANMKKLQKENKKLDKEANYWFRRFKDEEKAVEDLTPDAEKWRQLLADKAAKKPKHSACHVYSAKVLAWIEQAMKRRGVEDWEKQLDNDKNAESLGQKMRGFYNRSIEKVKEEGDSFEKFALTTSECVALWKETMSPFVDREGIKERMAAILAKCQDHYDNGSITIYELLEEIGNKIYCYVKRDKKRELRDIVKMHYLFMGETPVELCDVNKTCESFHVKIEQCFHDESYVNDLEQEIRSIDDDWGKACAKLLDNETEFAAETFVKTLSDVPSNVWAKNRLALVLKYWREQTNTDADIDTIISYLVSYFEKSLEKNADADSRYQERKQFVVNMYALMVHPDVSLNAKKNKKKSTNKRKRATPNDEAKPLTEKELAIEELGYTADYEKYKEEVKKGVTAEKSRAGSVLAAEDTKAARTAADALDLAGILAERKALEDDPDAYAEHVKRFGEVELTEEQLDAAKACKAKRALQRIDREVAKRLKASKSGVSTPSTLRPLAAAEGQDQPSSTPPTPGRGDDDNRKGDDSDDSLEALLLGVHGGPSGGELMDDESD